MGCTNSSDGTSASSEELVHTIETGLGFSQCLAARLVSKIHCHSTSGRMNKKQFRDMMQAVGLCTDPLEDPDAPASRFFQYFSEGKRYEAKKLAMLAILLGKGTIDTKAELLFSLYQSEKAIELPAVDKMVQDICSIALKYLPAYASLELEALSDFGSARKLNSYQAKLEVAYAFVVAKLRDNLEFGRKRVTLVELKRSKLFKFFHSPQASRLFAIELFEKIPRDMRAKRIGAIHRRCNTEDEETRTGLDLFGQASPSRRRKTANIPLDFNFM